MSLGDTLARYHAHIIAAKAASDTAEKTFKEAASPMPSPYSIWIAVYDLRGTPKRSTWLRLTPEEYHSLRLCKAITLTARVEMPATYEEFIHTRISTVGLEYRGAIGRTLLIVGGWETLVEIAAQRDPVVETKPKPRSNYDFWGVREPESDIIGWEVRYSRVPGTPRSWFGVNLGDAVPTAKVTVKNRLPKVAFADGGIADLYAHHRATTKLLTRKELDAMTAPSARPDFDPKWRGGHTTRDGRKAEIVRTDLNADAPILAVVTNCDGRKSAVLYNVNGRTSLIGEKPIDLINKVVERVVWVNFHRSESDGSITPGEMVHDNEATALSYGVGRTRINFGRTTSTYLGAYPITIKEAA